MGVIEDFRTLELIEAIAAVGFLGGIFFFLMGALWELTGQEVSLERWFLTGSAAFGWGAVVWILLERAG